MEKFFPSAVAKKHNYEAMVENNKQQHCLSIIESALANVREQIRITCEISHADMVVDILARFSIMEARLLNIESAIKEPSQRAEKLSPVVWGKSFQDFFYSHPIEKNSSKDTASVREELFMLRMSLRDDIVRLMRGIAAVLLLDTDRDKEVTSDTDDAEMPKTTDIEHLSD